MENGDVALFAWDETGAYWMGNTETPEALWRTEKYTFSEVPSPIAEWAERELLAQLHQESPWLAEYPHLSWFFLPVFLSKDGRETSREFFTDHAAGFPVEDPEPALQFYEDFLATGVLDEYRHLMAGKLGTSEGLNLVRMTAAMGEFNAAYLLDAAGYELEPEAPVSTGHSLDFRVETGEEAHLAEVTHPAPPHRRSASSAVEAVRRTAATKVDGQLDAHGGGVLLMVDCTSFTDAEWDQIRRAEPAVGHRPAVVYRLRPDGTANGYADGHVPIDLGTLA
jgi:catechol 2,3-dioxygenase-like lactoylglutathione lyase family enzyme